MRLGQQAFELVAPIWDDDGHGNTIATYPPTAPATTITGCSIQPGSTAEDLIGRDQVTVRWVIYAPPGTVVDAYYAARYRDELYHVEAAPDDWSDHGPLGHVRLILIDQRG